MKKKTSLLKSYAKKNSSIIENLPLLSKSAILQQRIHLRNKQTNKQTSAPIIKYSEEGSTFTTFSGHTRKGKRSSSPPQGYQEPSRSTILPFQGRQKSINVKTAAK